MPILLPEDLAEACSMLSGSDAGVPLAGGTDLLVNWPQRLGEHERTYVDLSKIDELRPLHFRDGELVLGGLTTYWDVIREPRIQTEFPLLVTAARQVGAIQIQSRGTWAGNIANASPAADGVPVLLAYDATVVLTSRSGREEVPLHEFYIGYKNTRRREDQLITSIRLPRRKHDVQVFEKVGARRAQSIAKVGVAMTRSRDGWRVAASSVAPYVCRCPALEQRLEDTKPVRDPSDLLPAIRRDVSPIDDLRSTARYREQVLARLIFFAIRGVEGASGGDAAP